jgi:hypothetical protein
LDSEDGTSLSFNRSLRPVPALYECQRGHSLPSNPVNSGIGIRIIMISFFLRICPGRYIAFDTIWLAIASLVAAFDMSTTTDSKTGKQVPDLDNHEYISALAM